MFDNDKILKCPACGKEMKKIYINSAKCNIDVCLDGCGGIYFDNREFKKMDENAENIDELLEAMDGKTFDKVTETENRICPMCHSNMVKHFASAKREIEIDECYACGGIFLDGGELMAIRNQFNTEEERSANFNEVFMNLHGSHLNPLDKDAIARVDFTEKMGKFIVKFFKLD